MPGSRRYDTLVKRRRSERAVAGVVSGLGAVWRSADARGRERVVREMDYIHELRKQIGPRKIILNCAGALIIRDGRILFQRRTDNGKWGLIGGLVEMNETYEQAALREIREETGLEVRLDSFLGIFHNHDMVWSNGDAAHVISALYTASIVSGEPRIDEESYELRFFGRDEIPELFAEDHIAALDAYFRGVRYPLLQENRYHRKAEG
uniref:NUDIX hydrolase n=1 Tax=uncultured bacterium Contig575 TaxID=1393592 RepID=W0FHY2_9BACT|nr:NUDIX hydrolase [uncultured bacterium Contig575]